MAEVEVSLFRHEQASSGKTVFVSAMTVVLGLDGMLVVKMPAFHSIGLGAMMAVGGC